MHVWDGLIKKNPGKPKLYAGFPGFLRLIGIVLEYHWRRRCQPTIDPCKARIKAHECRESLLDGTDPLEAKNAIKDAQKVEIAKTVTFRHCAKSYHLAYKDGWKNAKHAAQWTNTMSTYAYPIIGELPVAAVDVGLIMKILEPIWKTKTETASRLRGRIESVIDYATARGLRSGENPARWKGHLDNLLMSRSAANKVAHHLALPHSEIPAFISELRKQEGVSQYALEFLILCANSGGIGSEGVMR